MPPKRVTTTGGFFLGIFVIMEFVFQTNVPRIQECTTLMAAKTVMEKSNKCYRNGPDCLPITPPSEARVAAQEALVEQETGR